MTPRQVLPSDSEARLIFMKLPSRIRRSLNDLADAGGCSTLEIVQRFQEGAGHPGFPEPPPTAASMSQKSERAFATETPSSKLTAAKRPRGRRPAKGGKT
jgi:hypothetical protein